MDAQSMDFHWLTAADVKELSCFLIPDIKISVDSLVQAMIDEHEQYH